MFGKKRVAIIGAGLTLFRRNLKETGKELAYEAAKMALDAAGMELRDIQSVVMGTAPDAFDGVHMKGEYLADGAGARNKPYVRVFVGGGTGVFSPLAGWWQRLSRRRGRHDRSFLNLQVRGSDFQPLLVAGCCRCSVQQNRNAEP